MKVLITGFAPFGGETMNPSWEAVSLLPDAIKEAELVKLKLPVTFKGAVELLTETIRDVKPDVVISVGQAGGRPNISMERIAVNLMDARIPDNEGCAPTDEPVIAGGDTAYFTTLPVKAMAEALNQKNIPAGLSCSAGTYVCNTVMYAALHLSQKQFPRMRAGFIHVPFAPEQLSGKAPNTPSMEISTMAKGLELAIETL